MSTRVWHRMVIAVLSLGFASLPVKAQTVGPLANTTVGNARLIVPDGSSVRQSISTGETRWFVFGAEPGKTYVVEAVDPDSDLVSNTIGSLHVYAANGTTTPPPETNVDCTASQRAPALEVPVAVDGMRCVVRAFPPSPGNTQNKRGLYVAVGLATGPSFEIRVRESTIYGRWTTNGYDFHVELENTTADAMCAEVIFLPNAGESYSGTWGGGLTRLQLTVPAFGANKLVFPNGTLVNADNKGTLRIGACPSPVNFVPTSLHVSTYAYNPLTDKFLYFFTNAANNGATANSFGAASGGAANAFVQGGNAFGVTATLGTTDTQSLNVLVGNQRVMRYEPTATSPTVIGGHSNNSADTFGGKTIAGGGKAGTNCYDPPTDTNSRSCGNQALQGFATVGGGYANIATGNEVTVGGGTSNTAGQPGFFSSGATVGGGENNTAGGDFATVGGGKSNTAGSLVSSSFGATVGGGSGNTASGDGATVGGGTGNIAAGVNATVPGGFENQALGASSFAAGLRAKALHDYSFVWGGDPNNDTLSQQAGDFVVYAPAPGAVRMYAGVLGAGGCILPNGITGWQCASDRNLKENFVELDGRDILHRLNSIPITRWNAKAVPNVQHIGPMAQDFYAAFGLGTDNLSIGTTDAQGVALAAIQALYAELKERDGTIAEQQHQIGDQDRRIADQQRQIADERREIAALRERVSATEGLRGELAALRAELADLRETRTQITARAPAAAYGSQADAAR